jgi:hypothetical protein
MVVLFFPTPLLWPEQRQQNTLKQLLKENSFDHHGKIQIRKKHKKVIQKNTNLSLKQRNLQNRKGIKNRKRRLNFCIA